MFTAKEPDSYFEDGGNDSSTMKIEAHVRNVGKLDYTT
jgi:hypothetical protein